MSDINNFFDKIYVINLDSRKDRYEECLVEFKKHDLIVERVSAIDGISTFKKGINRNAGNHGLILTNIKIIEDAIKNKYTKILILEDDVMFVNNLNLIFKEKIFFMPNDWDLLYLGGSHLFNKGMFNCLSNEINFKIDGDTYKLLNNDLCSTTWTQTTHAVGINCVMFETLLHHMKTKALPIDIIYCELQQSGFGVYTFLPSIALQRPSFSDIEKQYVDYNTNKRWTF